MKNFMKKIVEKASALKNKAYLAAMSAYTTVMCAIPAFATGNAVQEKISTMVDTGVTFVFNFAGGAIILGGAFSMIMAIYKFISATNARDGEAQREAGNNIGIALMILALGAGVFVLKSPVMDLVKALMG